jgi:predicted regulator of Ras-like GTPase activity (Roadblock/LC7/MglB family)
MVPESQLQGLNERLEDLEKKVKAKDIVLVQSNGLYIAGKIPEGAHKETYAAQGVINYGSAKVINEELGKGRACEGIVVEYKDEKLYVCGAGDAVLVARFDKTTNIGKYKTKLNSTVMDLGRLIFYDRQKTEQKTADDKAQKPAEKKD